MYDITALYEAKTIAHGIELLQEHPEAVVIAGGSDVLIRVREGRLAGCELVSIRNLAELRGVSLDPDETLRIGPLTVFSELTRHRLIQRHIPVLGEAADQVGGPQIRNIGTIGGNICNGVSSADTASTLMAWDAVLEYTGPSGARTVPIEQHYLAAGKTALAHDELLTAILIPKQSYQGYYGEYIKYALRNAMDIAILGCSVNVKLAECREKIEKTRIAFGVAGPVPLRVRVAEDALRGKPVAEAESLAKTICNGISPRTSWRGTKEFRLHLAEELTKRALNRAIRRAGGII